jgi:FixJ family two-component response regulator
MMNPFVRRRRDSCGLSDTPRRAFASAEDFLQSDRLHDASCLISDVQMPGLTGIELQHRLAAAGNRMPVIFITAFPEERIRTRALAAGAYGFLAKPFSDESLIGCLDKALKSGDAAERAEQ